VISVEKRKTILTPLYFAAPLKGARLGIGYRR